MARHTNDRDHLQPPFALRPDDEAFFRRPGPAMPSLLKRLRAAPIFSPIPAFKPIAVGTVAAIAFGLMFDVGPWDTITGRLLGTADAQEALPQTGRVAEPSEADRAALRYFASRGETERLEAELLRLRALYPGWTPPRDLLDPGGEDLELQRIYELVGEQDYGRVGWTDDDHWHQ